MHLSRTLKELALQVVKARDALTAIFQNLKQKQIGTELGYSQMHVSRVLRRALQQMRDQLV